MTTVTFTKTYTIPDRRPDFPGPWDTEPDKAQWIDQATGLDCLIVRNRGGALCGYVGVPAGHPWHGKDYWGDLAPRLVSALRSVGPDPLGRGEVYRDVAYVRGECASLARQAAAVTR